MGKILLVGASGYVGGTVLAALVASHLTSLKSLTFDLLVRSSQQAAKLRAVYGERVKTIAWTGLDDTQFIEQIAGGYDIIVNAGSGFIATGAKAFVDGLGRRVQEGLPAPWLLHLSGCTNLVDFSQQPHEWNDKDSQKIFDFMKLLDMAEPYEQRTTEITVLETAAEKGVQAVSLQAPCIFGEGTGLFNQQGLVVPSIIRYVVQYGYGFKLNDQANFDYVHVADLAEYFVLIIRAILERPDRGVGCIPSGKRGILFPTVGRATIADISQKAVDTAFDLGILPREGAPQERVVRVVSLEHIADELTAGRRDIAKRGWGGEKAVKGTIGREILGWTPTRLEEAWNQDFSDELKALLDERRGETFERCIGGAPHAVCS